MKPPSAFLLLLLLLTVASIIAPTCSATGSSSADCNQPPSNGSYMVHPIPVSDGNPIQFALNLEYLECEFFLFGALGYGLDTVAPQLAAGGPPPIGGQKANLDANTRDIILQFAYQEVGHIRAIKASIANPFPRVLLNISKEEFAATMEVALGKMPQPFDAYANTVNYLLASYLIPYVGLTGYVGANPLLQGTQAKRLVAGLLGVESGQDAVLRTLLYDIKDKEVYPGLTVATATDRISMLRNKLGKTGIVDEGLYVPKCLGAEGKVNGNILSADAYSVSYARTPAEILRIVYGTGDESKPGGFYPKGAMGVIAESYLHQ